MNEKIILIDDDNNILTSVSVALKAEGWVVETYNDSEQGLIALQRDTPDIVKDYLSNFDNKFVGITGDPGEIFLLSQSWGIISQKIFFENGDYNIDHSSPVILLKDGKYIAKISHRDDIKKSIKLINKYL